MFKRLMTALCLVALMAAGAGAGEETIEKQKKEYDAHRQYVKIHFNDDEMDFALQWILGSVSNGGCEIGEAFYTVGNIKDGSPESWQEQWEIMAGRIEARAEQSLMGGHKVSAREAFLRASNYYRTAVVSMLPDNPKFIPLSHKSRSCLKRAGKLHDPQIEYFEIPFEGTVMPGYFIKANNNGQKTKTLIMIGGGETYIEDCYFYVGPPAVKRGYNFMTIDLPGQGLMPTEGKFYRPDTEVPIKAVLDYALGRPEVDPERLAMYGISGGGYFVPRAAVVDKRIKACVLNAAVIDEYSLFAQMPNAKATPDVLKSWGAFHKNTAGVVSWRWGLDPSDIAGLVEVNKGYQFDPAKVECPVLVLIGEGEYANKEVKRQQHACLDALPNPVKKLVITPEDAGASSHCVGENRSLMSQVVFDWLDELFKKQQNVN